MASSQSTVNGVNKRPSWADITDAESDADESNNDTSEDHFFRGAAAPEQEPVRTQPQVGGSQTRAGMLMIVPMRALPLRTVVQPTTMTLQTNISTIAPHRLPFRTEPQPGGCQDEGGNAGDTVNVGAAFEDGGPPNFDVPASAPAPTPAPITSQLKRGTFVTAKYDGEYWLPAEVVDVVQQKIKVHWVGYGEDFDEWLDAASVTIQ